MSRLLDILGSKYPIIQGPIGELNDPKMVAADTGPPWLSAPKAYRSGPPC